MISKERPRKYFYIYIFWNYWKLFPPSLSFDFNQGITGEFRWLCFWIKFSSRKFKSRKVNAITISEKLRAFEEMVEDVERDIYLIKLNAPKLKAEIKKYEANKEK